MKILIFGASGSGTTTLGRELEKQINFKHLDADDYYWKKTEIPFQEKTPLQERNKFLKTDIEKYENVVVSGSLVSWGKEWTIAFDLAVFIYLKNEVRMQRLKARELERYGNELLTDKKLQEKSKTFIEWASKYDDPSFDGRSLKIHNEWITNLNCPVLRLDGEEELEVKVKQVISQIDILTKQS